MRNITGQIQNADEFFRCIFESLEDYAIFTADRGGLITTWNRGAERLLGYAREEAIGEPLSLIFTDEDIKTGVPEKEIGDATENGSAADERWHERKDGSKFWASGRLSVLYNDADEPAGLIKIVRDLTSRQNDQEKLEQANHQLQAQSQELRHLSWELTRAEQQERQRFAEELHEDLAQLLASGRMKLVTLKHGGLSAKQAATDLDVLLQRAVQFVQQLVAALNPTILEEVGLVDALHWLAYLMERDFALNVDVQIHEEPDPQNGMLRTVLFQAARELLMNVDQHALVSEAQLSLWRNDGQIHLRVRDQGAGYGITQPPRKPSGHEPLGLARLRNRLELVNGSLAIDSVPEQGTSVLVSIPVDPANEVHINAA